MATASHDGRVVMASPQSGPVLRAGVDLVTIDVQVTPAKNAVMPELTAADFDIRISGRARAAASVTLLHFDDGTVTRSPLRTDAGSSSTCAFGFHRKIDRTTAHYLIGVEQSAADQVEVKQVQVKMTQDGLAVQWIVWRSPIHRTASRLPPRGH